jgi:membrane-bound inhibitor of C-type lysozyme
MISSHSLLGVAFLLTVACGSGETDSSLEATTDSAATATDSVVVPVAAVAPPVTSDGDTILSLPDMVCGEDLAVAPLLRSGAERVLSLRMEDSSFTLNSVASTSGDRYRNSTGELEWWSDGDSISLSRGGQTVSCRPAEVGEVEF